METREPDRFEGDLPVVLYKNQTDTTISLLALIVAVMMLHSSPAEAQMKLMIEGDAFMVREIGATIVQNDDNLEVVFMLPEDSRPEAYKSVDIREKDLILMVNGKKVKSVSDIRELFDGIKPGEDVKIGLKRDKSMMIVSFERADPESLPEFKTMTFTSIDSSDGESEGGVMKVVKRMETSGGKDDIELTMLEGSGLVIGESEDGLIIAAVMPDAKESLASADVKKGDRLISVQGEKTSSVAALAKLFDEIEVGTAVTLDLAREGQPFSVTFDKAKSQPKTMIINK
jgi:C-terminal processing protease CtpA/Prc